MTSTVKWFDDAKGFGFITDPKGGGDIFVHYSEIMHMTGRRTLKEGDLVTFEVASNGAKGRKAVKLYREPEQ